MSHIAKHFLSRTPPAGFLNKVFDAGSITGMLKPVSSISVVEGMQNIFHKSHYKKNCSGDSYIFEYE